MHIAYLINQYPKTSHTFVRREIHGLEQLGLSVSRFSVRRTRDPLVHLADIAEARETCVLLERRWSLLVSVLWCVCLAPTRFVSAFTTACGLGRKSERGVLAHVIYLAEACLLSRILRQKRIDHIHAHFGTNSATVAMLASCLHRGTFSFTVHGPEEFDHPQAIGLPEKIKAAKFVVAISEFGRSQLYRWCSVDQWSKIQVVHCVVGDEFLDAEPTPIPGAPRLVCVGRLCEQKGQLLLVQAIAELVRLGFSPTLRLVGDGELREPIERMIQQLGLAKNVEILGWMSSDEVAHEIRAARAFVLPSFAEGLPVAIMEAMSAHRPVVSTYVAGIPELVRPGVNGWLVPAGSLPDLVSALRHVMESSPEELSQMGQAGAKIVRTAHRQLTEAKKLALLLGKCEPAEFQAANGGARPKRRSNKVSLRQVERNTRSTTGVG